MPVCVADHAARSLTDLRAFPLAVGVVLAAPICGAVLPSLGADPFSLLLQVFKKHPNPHGQSQHKRVLVDLESFLVRKAVCGLTSRNYNRFFAQLVADLNASRSAFSAGDVRARLVAETADTQRWPTDDEFWQAWMTIEFYKRLKKSRNRFNE
jgi:hypothetical protein